MRPSNARPRARITSPPAETYKAAGILDAAGFSSAYRKLLEAYQLQREPITVNFRELVPLSAGADRASHLVHSYPAKLLVGIPAFFANCEQLSRPGDLVLDPFCGTGTVLLEALLAGRSAGGSDSNPLARLIAKVKVTPLDPRAAIKALSFLRHPRKKYDVTKFSAVVEVDRWYARGTATALGRLLTQIKCLGDQDIQDFFIICFSACLKRLSFADPRLSVPVRLKDEHSRPAPSEAAVRNAFFKVAEANIARMKKLDFPKTAKFIGIREDARVLDKPFAGANAPQASLLITSPPYLSAQKYIRSCTLSLGWLGLAPKNKLRNLEDLCIGREHLSSADRTQKTQELPDGIRAAIDEISLRNPARGAIANAYFVEMRAALGAAIAALRDGGHLVLVMGNNTVCGKPFRTSDHVASTIKSMGMKQELELIDHIKSRGLMTKRNVTAGMITQEHIHVFSKTGRAA